MITFGIIIYIYFVQAIIFLHTYHILYFYNTFALHFLHY